MADLAGINFSDLKMLCRDIACKYNYTFHINTYCCVYARVNA